MKGWAITVVIAAVILIGGAFYLFSGAPAATAPVATSTPVDQVPVTTKPDTTASSTPNTSDLVRLVSVKSGDLVKSPLTVTGEARGTWYFEASFPVRILDANGKELGVMPAQAQGDWMTTNFVPFKVVLPFATSTTATGTLVLEKDNPSGLPEHDASIRIPIRFR
jgi:hypothetical protein